MQLRTTAKVVVATAAILSTLSAAPFLAIGDGAELFVTGALSVRADDNVLLTSKATSDTIFEISPGLEIVFGKNAALKGSLSLVDSFTNYSDNSKLNTNLFSGDLKTNYDDAKLKLNFMTGYHELNQNAPRTQGAQIVPGLIRRDEFVVGAGAEAEVSQISAVGVGVNFNHLNYKPKGYADSDDLTIPVNFYYKMTPKVDLSLGYRYRNYETTIGSDSKDHFFNVGARGEFSPKLTGQVAVGVNTRKLSIGGSETLPGFEASVNYEISPKTKLQLGTSNDFGTAPQGGQQKNLSFYGNIATELDQQWSVSAGLSNRSIDYYKSIPSRTDNYFEGTAGVAYTVNSYVKINASYIYRNNDSDLVGGSFKNNVFAIAANLRY
jgi:hypothetical protein